MTAVTFWSRKTTSLLGILFSEKYVALKRSFCTCKKYLCMVKVKRGKPKLAVQNVHSICLMGLIVLGLWHFFVIREYQLFSDGKLNSLDGLVLKIF